MEDWQFNLAMVICLVIILVIGYSCLAMASKYDEISQKDWEEFSKMHNKEDADE